MFSVYMTEADVTMKIIFVVLKGAQEIQYSFKENVATRLLYPRIAETCTFCFTLLVFQTFFFSCLFLFLTVNLHREDFVFLHIMA